MSFKVSDLVLCVDARTIRGNVTSNYRLREGAVYTVRAVPVCCCTRLALVGLGNAMPRYVCRCGAVMALAWFAWRFVKVGEQRRNRRTADEMLRDSFYDDAVRYSTKEV